MTLPRVSVIICTWNRSHLLEQTLGRLEQIWWPPAGEAELVVVNNASTDRTDEVARAFAARLPLRVVVEPAPGASNARNRGIRETTAPLVLFTDDDVLADREWIAGFLDATERFKSAGVFGGPIEPWFPQAPDPDLVAAFPMLAGGFAGLDHRRDAGPLPPALDVYGANMGFRRQVFDRHSFDPRLGPVHDAMSTNEETRLLDQLRADGIEVVWVPGMRLQHYVSPERMTLSYLIPYTRGLAQGEVRRGGPPDGTQLLGVPRWVLREAAEAKIRYYWHWLMRNRRDALSALRVYTYQAAVAAECRALRREQR